MDIGELTWEQKEKVLRLLYARMNGLKAANRSAAKSAPQNVLSIANKRFVDYASKGHVVFTYKVGFLLIGPLIVRISDQFSKPVLARTSILILP